MFAWFSNKKENETTKRSTRYFNDIMIALIFIYAFECHKLGRE